MYGRRPQQQPYGRGGYGNNRGGRSGGGGLISGRFKIMLIIALLYGGYAVIKYYSNTQVNPITGEKQRVSLTTEEEIAIGLQATPQMVKQHGGLHPDPQLQKYVKTIGQKLLRTNLAVESDYQYDFHLLYDPQVINAFALPGGQVFITEALFSKLENEDQLAGIIGHEIGHVIHRHGAERMAKMELTQGLTMAAVIGAGDASMAQMAQYVGNLVNMKYGRDQELESDEIGVVLAIQAGYDPYAMLGVMDILEAASGSNRQPEFMSTHPSPDNRREKITESIERYNRGIQ